MFDYPSRLKTVIEAVVALGNTVKQHPRATVLVVVLAGLYAGLYWFAVEYPALTVRSFYNAIDARRPYDAWDLIYPPYQKRWSNDPKKFADGFTTTVAHTELTVEFAGNRLNPIDLALALFASSIEYDVSFTATDRFTREDCLREEQQYDCLWLRIKNQTEYEQLMNGTLSTAEAVREPNLEITRQYKKRMTLYRESWGTWLISKILPREEGIRR